MDSLQQLFRLVRRGVEVTFNSLFTESFKRENRGGAIGAKGTDQLLLVGVRDGVPKDEEIKTGAFTVRDGLGEAKRGFHLISMVFQEHPTGRQQTPVIRDRKNAFRHDVVDQKQKVNSKAARSWSRAEMRHAEAVTARPELLLSSPITAKNAAVCG